MQISILTEMLISYPRSNLYRTNVVFYLALNILETRSRCSICFMLVFHFSESQCIEAFSKIIFSNLNAFIKSGFLVFESGVFLFTDTQI